MNPTQAISFPSASVIPRGTEEVRLEEASGLLPLPCSPLSSQEGVREPPVMAPNHEAEEETSRYVVQACLRKAGWDRPECHSYSLRQWICHELIRLWSAMQFEDEQRRGKVQVEKFSSDPSRFNHTSILHVSTLLYHFANASKGSAEITLPKVFPAIQFLKERCQSVIPWVDLLRLLSRYYDFFERPIALICQMPVVRITPTETIRSLLLDSLGILSLQGKAGPPILEEDSCWLIEFLQKTLRSLRKMKSCEEACKEAIKATVNVASIRPSFLPIWEALCCEIRFGTRTVSDPRNEEIVQEIVERVKQRLYDFHDISSSYRREVFRGGQALLASLNTLYGLLPKERLDASALLDRSRFDNIRERMTGIIPVMQFMCEFERSFFSVIGRDLHNIQFAPKKAVEVTSFEQADSQALLELLVETKRQKEVRSVLTLRGEKMRAETISSLTLNGLESKLEEEQSREAQETITAHESICQGRCFLELFLLNPMRERVPISIPRGLVHFAALHRDPFVRPASRQAFLQGMTSHAREGEIMPRMRGLYNHLYLSACGVELMTNLLRDGRSDLLSAVLPVWIADRYLMAELQGDVLFLDRGERPPERHSLLVFEEVFSHKKPLSLEARDYLRQLSSGIFWYRYSLARRDEAMEAQSSEWRWFERCHQLTREGRKLDSEKQAELIEFIKTKQSVSYHLLYHSFPPVQEEMDRCVELIKGHFESWKRAFLERGQACSPSLAAPILSSEEVAFFDQMIDKVKAFLSGPSSEEPVEEQRRTIEEVLFHLIRFKNSIEIASLYPDDHFMAFHYRSMLHVQWLFEHIYQLGCMLAGCVVERTHRFLDYEEALNRSPKGRPFPPLDMFFEYNCGIGLHYEELFSLPLCPFEEYRLFLEQNCFQAMSEDGFTPVGARTCLSKDLYEARLHRLVRGLFDVLHPFFESLV